MYPGNLLFRNERDIANVPKKHLSMFSRQEYWSGLPFPPPADLPDPGIKPTSPASPALQAGSLLIEPSGKPIPSEESISNAN